MRGAGGLALILCLWAAPGTAQDRPPETPPGTPTETPLVADEASRPPDTPPAEVADDKRPPEEQDGGDAPADDPAEPEAGDAPAPDPATGDPVAEPAPAGAADESPDAPPAEAQAFGPPPPPAWFTLAGDPARDAACRLALSHMGADFRPQPPVTDPENRDCGIAWPLQVLRILPDVALEGAPLLRCETALALALWTRDFVQPAAATLPDAPRLTALRTGPGYSCRDRVGTGEADPKPSEHGYGNAVDVMGFVFGEAEAVPVQPRQGDGDPLESFQRAVQGTACLFFATVLGPGSNAAHDDHLHLDVAARNGGWRLCE